MPAFPTQTSPHALTPFALDAAPAVVLDDDTGRASGGEVIANTSGTQTPAAPGPFEREILRRLRRGQMSVLGSRRLRNETMGSNREGPGQTNRDGRTFPDDDPLPELWPFRIDERPDEGQSAKRSRNERSRAVEPWRAPLPVAVALTFARALDAAPGLVSALRGGAPRVIVSVPDPLVLSVLRGIWKVVLFGDRAETMAVERGTASACRDACVALTMMPTDVPKPRDRASHEEAFLRALAVPLPIVAIVPDPGFLPDSAAIAATHRLTLPALDAGLIAATVRIVTGRRPDRQVANAAGLAPNGLSMADLAIAVRADRSYGDCLAELRRLQAERAAVAVASGVGRDLSLDQLHGLAEAVAWARGALDDLAAWRAGAPWSSVASGLVVAGPPGCGKTLLAQAMAVSGRIPLIAASLAQWQSADTAHLGTTLRAMRATFEEARVKARSHGGSIILIDEIDSFPDRSTVNHEYRDYVVEVQNALLECLDGATPREGVICIGTTNAPERLDPALVRPGRLGRVIRIGTPNLDERLAMFRVRLGADLKGVDLMPIARVTERATGAEIDEMVNEARRRARRAGRDLSIGDLEAAAGQDRAAHDPALFRRTAIHEAGHALVAALELGTEDLVVALQVREGAAGWVAGSHRRLAAGTRRDIEALIRVGLAGHAAETVLLGGPSAAARSDLRMVTQFAADLYGNWGLAGSGRLLALGSDRPTEILADPVLRAEAGRLLEEQHARVCAWIEERRCAVAAIADRLMEERLLDGAAVAALIVAHPPAGRHP